MNVSTVPLGEVVTRASVRRAGHGDYPVLSMTMHDGLVDQHDKFKKRVASPNTEGYRVVQHGQLVVGFPIDEGVLSFQRRYPEAIVSPAYQIWDLDDRHAVDASYLELYLRSPRAIAYYKGRLRGTTARRRSLPKKSFLEMPVPLPPIAEQKRIARVLDAADALRAKRRESLAQLDTLIQSTFLDMFGDPVTNPMGWDVSALGEVCVDRPAYGSGAASCNYDPSLPRYVRITDVDATGELSDESKSAKLTEKDIQKYRLGEGDVLFARSGATVGKSYLYRAKHGFCVYAGYMIRFRPDPKILLPEVLFRFTQTPAYWHWVDSQARTVAQPNINAKMYSALPVAHPPIDLQRGFATIVASIERQKARQRAHLAELDTLFASLQSRAFQGEL